MSNDASTVFLVEGRAGDKNQVLLENGPTGSSRRVFAAPPGNSPHKLITLSRISSKARVSANFHILSKDNVWGIISPRGSNHMDSICKP